MQTSGKGASSDNGQGAMPHARRRDRDVCGMEEGSRKCLTRVAATDARGGGRRVTNTQASERQQAGTMPLRGVFMTVSDEWGVDMPRERHWAARPKQPLTALSV